MQPGSSFCSACGGVLAPGARFCGRCGTNAGAPAGAGGQATVVATFPPAVLPQAPGNAIPEELLARWTWGPFWLAPLWAFWNADTLHKVLGVVLFLLSFLTGFFTIVLFGYGIYLGFRGNRIAAANRRFSSLDEFLAVQHAWSMWGLITAIVELVLFAALFMILLLFGFFAVLFAH